MSHGCEDCICRGCLYWWSERCPYGRCYDDHRAEADPYDVAHPDEPPRTMWSQWETQQAYWCRGGMFYPVSYCEHFVEYKGQQVRECLRVPVSVFQDGYIQCTLVDTIGCQWCYKSFMARMEEG
jgi:hypothetical protein